MALQPREGLSPRYLRSATIRNAAAPPSQRGRRGRPEHDAMTAPHDSAQEDHVAPSPPPGAGMITTPVVSFLLLAPLSRCPPPYVSCHAGNATESPPSEPSTEESSSDTSLSDTSGSDSCSSSTELAADSGSSSRGSLAEGTAETLLAGDDVVEGHVTVPSCVTPAHEQDAPPRPPLASPGAVADDSGEGGEAREDTISAPANEVPSPRAASLSPELLLASPAPVADDGHAGDEAQESSSAKLVQPPAASGGAGPRRAGPSGPPAGNGAQGDAIAAFISGVPGAHRVRPNLRRNVVAVDTLPGEDLTALLAVRVICDVRVRAKALFLNTCTGTLFDVDPTFDGATIYEGLESSVPVVAVTRSGDVVTLRFAGSSVPEEVLLFRRRRAVRPRLPRPLQCGRCGLFGHATVTCSRDPRCLQCAGRHPTSACTVERHRCLHCGGPHAATEPRCPQWQLERRVAAAHANSKPRITRKQALELARGSGATAAPSPKQHPAAGTVIFRGPHGRNSSGQQYQRRRGRTARHRRQPGAAPRSFATGHNRASGDGARLGTSLPPRAGPRRLAGASHVCGGTGNA
ncbi:hypothetical protein HPB49_003741 [Dermacentor silvarum]|uniref:Uncharacterized protein n=1 Tax=Dermacentor silvarum TaxID=543639 RepID=A0ACB8CD90_DERSI|nr:hypothetical protein HPB49_003741 [Dermacentor silvarum]